MTKILSNEQHNAKINAKIKTHQDKILELKKELKAISPVKQASLAQCNAMSKVKLRPKSQAIKLKSPQLTTSLTAEAKAAIGEQV